MVIVSNVRRRDCLTNFVIAEMAVKWHTRKCAPGDSLESSFSRTVKLFSRPSATKGKD